MKPTVFLAMPHYTSHIHLAAAEAFFATASQGGCSIVARRTYGGSLLAKSFNMLWAQGITAHEAGDARYFVMLHSDIGPEQGWVDKLVRAIEEHEADMVSAVVPLKSTEGLTSTAIDNDGGDIFEPSHRLTLSEVAKLPETFTAANAGYPGRCLLVNTGCFIVDMDKPWANRHAVFSIEDCIRYSEGMYQVGVAPEDWQWSRMLHRNGAKVMATTSVQLTHYGEIGYPNYGGWGKCKTDPRRQVVAK